MTSLLSGKKGAILGVFLATLGLSLKGIWARLAYQSGASVPDVLFYRALFSVPLILVCAAYLNRAHKQLGDVSKEAPRRDVVRAVLLGAFFSVGMFCDFQAIRALGAGVSRVVLFGYPLFVLLLESLRKRTWPAPQKWVGFFVAWAGLLLVCKAVGPDTSGWTQLPKGLHFGLLSLVLYALYIFFSGNLSTSLGATRLSKLSNLATSFVVVVVLLVHTQVSAQRAVLGFLPAVHASALLWIAVMVIVSTVLPYFLMMEGISRLGAGSASMLSMTGPPMTLGFGWFVLGETLTPAQILGAVLVLFGVAAAERRKTLRQSRAFSPSAPALLPK